MITDPLITTWISWLRGGNVRSVATVQTYRRHLQMALDKLGRDPADVTLDHLTEYLNHLADVRQWQANSLRVTVAALRSFFGYCSGNGRLPRNPAAMLRRPPAERREIRTLRLEQIQRIVLDAGPCIDQTPRELRDRLIFGLSYALGLRAHEVTWLRLDQVDIDEQEVSVLIKASKHGRRDHRRPIRDQELAGMLLIYMDRHRRKMPGSQWLFPSRQADRHGPGGRLSVRQIQRIFHGQLAKAGIRPKAGYRHHMLRASLTTHHLEAGADFHHVQQWMRHSDGSTTLLYARHVEERRLAAYLHSRRGLGPRDHRDFKRDARQDLGILRPRDRGSGRLPA